MDKGEKSQFRRLPTGKLDKKLWEKSLLIMNISSANETTKRQVGIWRKQLVMTRIA